MKVSTIFGANAYAVIETDGRRTDIRLSPGKSAAQNLREYAAEQIDRATHLRRMADLAAGAAEILENRKG